MNSLENASPKQLKLAWEQLCTSGTANKALANLLKVGIGPFLQAFETKYLGPDGVGQGFKLVLGQNGEGKTHLLYCLRELALKNGHVVALLDPKTAGGDSPFDFAREILRRLETPGVSEGQDEELKLVQLLRTAAQKKRESAEEQKLDPERIVPVWADGFRGKNLHPREFAAALADGLEAAFEGDEEGLRKAAARVAFEGVKLGKKQAELDGAALLRSIPLAVRHLGFRAPVILVDEAETAVDRKGNTRRREFLKFLRFLNDHVAHGTSEQGAAIVVIGCTDEFWPEQFAEYEALRQRLSDPGRDELEEREDLSPKARVRLNKLWVRETFRGDEADYEELGTVMVDLAMKVHPDTQRDIQISNAKRLARFASSNRVRKQVKRNFVKALAQLIERQNAEEKQFVLEEQDAAKALDIATSEIQEQDVE